MPLLTTEPVLRDAARTQVVVLGVTGYVEYLSSCRRQQPSLNEKSNSQNCKRLRKALNEKQK